MRREYRARRRKAGGTDGAFQAINITPFTDVLLVLLIIFLIAGSSMAPSGVDVDKLSTRSGGGSLSQAEAKVTRLQVSESGGLLRSSGEALSSADLERLKKDSPIDLAASEDCSVGIFVAEYDRLLRMGFRDVRLAEPSSLELQ